MMIKKVLILAICMLLSISSISCSAGNSNTEVKKEYSNSGLKIFYIYYQNDIKKTIALFKEKHGSNSIEETEFKNGQFEDYKTKLTTSVMAGEGPDLIVDNFGIFNSLQKVMKSGVYLDLNPLIAADGDFKPDDYYSGILDYGVLNGKRYFIPFSYDIDEFMTTAELLKTNNINIDLSNWTWRAFADIAKAYMARNDKKPPYLIGCNFWFSTMVNNSGLSLVDFKNKKTFFNSKEFIELLQCFRDIQPSVCPYEIAEKYQEWEDILNNECLISKAQNCGTPYGLFTFSSLIKTKLGSELVLLPSPTYSGNGKTYPYPLQSIGINSNCRKTADAFDFVKILLSKNLQSWRDENKNQNFNLHSQVNIKAYEADKAFFNNNESTKEFTGDGIIYSPLTKQFNDLMDNRMGRSDKTELLDQEIIMMIEKEALNYVNNKVTAEQAAKAIDNQVTLFLNE